jgi:hypothetical protein
MKDLEHTVELDKQTAAGICGGLGEGTHLANEGIWMRHTWGGWSGVSDTSSQEQQEDQAEDAANTAGYGFVIGATTL